MQALDPVFVTFYPHAVRSQQGMISAGRSLTHYTSAEALLGIVKNNRVWLRNARLMNDFSETEHGNQCVSRAWNGSAGDRLRTILNGMNPGIKSSIENRYNNFKDERYSESYILSLSEGGGVDNVAEDIFGRLSMWRAYGGNTNVCMVLDESVLQSNVETGAYTFPVLYMMPDKFEAYFSDIVNGFEARKKYFSNLDADLLAWHFSSFFHFSALSTKHPGFAEEREWRVIFSPGMFPTHFFERTVISLNGLPQVIYQLPLVDHLNGEVLNLSPNRILKKLIIGPTENPYIMFRALSSLLEESGFSNPESLISVSAIPLRR